MKPAILAFLTLFLAVPTFAYHDEVTQNASPFSFYKPIYFAFGDPDTKIQLSIKAQPAADTDLYLAYSQIMMWELRKPSDPMRDINYAPEIFYRFYTGGVKTSWFDLGFEHESNGRDGWETRSWNRSYLRYFKQFTFGNGMTLDAGLTGWLPYGYDELSHDLPQYCGIYEGLITLGHFLPGTLALSDLTVRFWGGGPHYINPAKGGQEVMLRLKFGQKFLPALVAQYFNGYGENQLDAAIRHSSFRIGIGF